MELKSYERVKGLGTGVVSLSVTGEFEMHKKAQYIQRGTFYSCCIIMFTVFLDTGRQENLGIGAKMMQ